VAGDPAAADEMAEIETALGRAVMLAHDPGSAAGRPVELVVARSDDAAAVAELFRSVDVIVGGSGMPAPPAALWIFETDPAISGTGVLPAESSPGDVLGATAAPVGGTVSGVAGTAVGSGLIPATVLRRPWARRRAEGNSAPPGLPGLIDPCPWTAPWHLRVRVGARL